MPDTVFLGPDPLDPRREPRAARRAHVRRRVRLDVGLRHRRRRRGWASACRCRSKRPTGFARVAVLGVRLSASAEHGGAMLEELIANHQFGPRGFLARPPGHADQQHRARRHRLLRQRPVRRPGILHRTRRARLRPHVVRPAEEQHRRTALLADALGIAYPKRCRRCSMRTRPMFSKPRAMNTALFPCDARLLADATGWRRSSRRDRAS